MKMSLNPLKVCWVQPFENIFKDHSIKAFSRELKETFFPTTLTDADKKALETAQGGPTPWITIYRQMPIKEFIL